jgi:hypothetical protein
MRLNWFSPLPPATSPAATYTARVLPFLKGRADVLLWTPQPLWDRGLERWAEVQSFHAEPLPWPEINQADAALYHLDESEGEPALIDVLNQHAGLIMTYAGPRPNLWERCLGVIVHDRETFTDLKAQNRWPLLLLPPPWDDGTAHALTAYKDHVESLLTFADESRRFSLRLTAEELARNAAREMRIWTADADRAPELPRAVQEIIALTSRPPVVSTDRKPRAA